MDIYLYLQKMYLVDMIYLYLVMVNLWNQKRKNY